MSETNNDDIASPHITLACVTGGDGDGDYRYDDILEYRNGDSWSKIGTMRDARRYHGTSVIIFKDLERYCNIEHRSSSDLSLASQDLNLLPCEQKSKAA